MPPPLPREVRSILFEEILGGVTVTWTLGELTRARDVDCFGYGVDYTGPNGYGGKRFGVRFDPEASAYVFDWSSATRVNHLPGCVDATPARIVVQYKEACVGLSEIGPVAGYSHVNGADVEVQIPVTVARWADDTNIG
jgi:hypothetical protein